MPAQAVVQRQRGADAEAILRIQTESSERITLHAFDELSVFVRLFVHLRGDGDAGNPARQERIQIEGIAQVAASGVDAWQRIS